VRVLPPGKHFALLFFDLVERLPHGTPCSVHAFGAHTHAVAVRAYDPLQARLLMSRVEVLNAGTSLPRRRIHGRVFEAHQVEQVVQHDGQAAHRAGNEGSIRALS
jgi:hypothetical protein